MADPSILLQAALVSLIESDETTSSLIGGVYDSVPDRPFNGRSSYISFGPSSLRDEYLVCVDREEHTVQLDVWSEAVGRVECKRIAGLVSDLVMAENLVLDLGNHALCRVEKLRHEIMGDPKRGISHGVLVFSFLIEVD